MLDDFAYIKDMINYLIQLINMIIGVFNKEADTIALL